MAVTPAQFWDGVAQRYSQQPIGDMDSYTKKLKTTQALMTADMTVLEFGCGTGSTALNHAPHVGKLVATDVSPAMIEIGREKARAASIDNVVFQQASIEDFTAEDGSFDMVLALNLLHLVPDHNRALEKIYSLLKPGGVFVSSTVCLADKMWFVRPIIPLMRFLGKAPYVSFLSAKNVIRDIEFAGFKEIEHWTHGRANSLFYVAKKP